MPSVSKSIRQQPDGRFLVRYRYGQKERRRVFDTRDQAADFIRAERKKIAAFGQMAVELTGSQLGRVMSLATDLARQMGEGTPLSQGIVQLEKAVQFWNEQKEALAEQERAGAIPLDQAIEELVGVWTKEDRDKGYVANAGAILRRFAADHSGKRFTEITADQIREWVLKQSPGTQVSSKARVSVLFSYALLKGWVKVNPCALFKMPRQKRKAVEIPRAEEIQGFLQAAQKPEWESIVPYLTLRLFSGIRGDEACLLEWKHIDFERSKVVVPFGIAAKGGPAREVPMSENLTIWLRAYRSESAFGRIAPNRVKSIEAKFRKTHQFTGPKWFNVLRHCFGSYRYPQLGSLDRLADEMGNSRRVLSSHYVGAVVPEDVFVFWSVVPELLQRSSST